MTKLKIKDGEMTTINYLENWHTIKLGDIVKEIIDNRGKTPPITSNGYELLEVNSIKSGYRHPDYSKVEKFINETTYRNWFRSGHILKDDLIIPTVGTIGGLAISPENRGSIAQNLIALRLKREVNPLFIYYLLSSLDYREKILNLDIGGVQPSIKVPHLMNLDITIPKPLTQAKVVGILSSLDDKIEMNRKINKNLEEIASTIFKKWFIDIGDELPEGWISATLRDYISTKTGKKDANIAVPGGAYPFFTCSKDNLNTDIYSFDTSALLLSGNGDFSIKWYEGKFEAYQRTYVLIPHKKDLLGLFYYLVKYFLNEITSGHRGSVIKFITKGMIDDFKINIPNDELLEERAKIFKGINQIIDCYKAETEKLVIIRDSLLPKIMSGRIIL